MPSDRGNPSIHVIFIEVFPKTSFLLWSIYDHRNLLSHCPGSYEILCPVRKTHADLKCESQPALKAFPDHEPLTVGYKMILSPVTNACMLLSFAGFAA